MLKLYDFDRSGNCYKARLLMSLLGLEYQLEAVDLLGGQQKSPEFLALNPWGQVPVLVDGDIIIRDSHAILVYLARRYGGETWLPSEPEAMALVMQWLATAANNIANSFAAARVYYLFGRALDIEAATNRSYALLEVFDDRLTARQWLEFDRPTIADLACFPYIGLAAEGKIELTGYPHVIAWLDRFKQLPGYISMPGL